MRVMGIDPGLTRCGLSVVQTGRGRQVFPVAVGVARTPSGAELGERLLRLSQAVREWMDDYTPDVVAIERTREFRGRYHVLGGALNPIEGIGPGDLHVTELMARLGDSTLTEIIIATNPNHTGEATASYLARQIGPMGIKVSRLASGLPVGGDLEYADEVTLGRAFEGRRVFA